MQNCWSCKLSLNWNTFSWLIPCQVFSQIWIPIWKTVRQIYLMTSCKYEYKYQYKYKYPHEKQCVNNRWWQSNGKHEWCWKWRREQLILYWLTDKLINFGIFHWQQILRWRKNKYKYWYKYKYKYKYNDKTTHRILIVREGESEGESVGGTLLLFNFLLLKFCKTKHLSNIL